MKTKEKKTKVDNKEEIRSYIKEKGLLDLTDMVINPLFTKEVMAYPNSGKPKPPFINSYDRTIDFIDHIQIF